MRTYAPRGCIIERFVHHEIRLHLETSLQCGLFKTTPLAAAQILPAFDRRRQVQSVVALHTVALCQDPTNFAVRPGLENNNTVDTFLTEYGDDQVRLQYISPLPLHINSC
jgi:hypothetical protein